MRRKKFHTRLQPIGEILTAALKKRGMIAPIRESAVFKLWPQAVGEQIAAQTRPDRLHAGTLFVRATSSVWVQQLHFMKEDIKQKLNQLAGKAAVDDIRFTVGYQPSRGKSITGLHAPGKTVLKDSDKKMIRDCTQSIADRELADIIQRVMEKEISRRRNLEETPGR